MALAASIAAASECTSTCAGTGRPAIPSSWLVARLSLAQLAATAPVASLMLLLNSRECRPQPNCNTPPGSGTTGMPSACAVRRKWRGLLPPGARRASRLSIEASPATHGGARGSGAGSRRDGSSSSAWREVVTQASASRAASGAGPGNTSDQRRPAKGSSCAGASTVRPAASCTCPTSQPTACSSRCASLASRSAGDSGAASAAVAISEPPGGSGAAGRCGASAASSRWPRPTAGGRDSSTWATSAGCASPCRCPGTLRVLSTRSRNGACGGATGTGSNETPGTGRQPSGRARQRSTAAYSAGSVRSRANACEAFSASCTASRYSAGGPSSRLRM